MSPQAGWILQEEIVSRLRSAIPRTVSYVGAEDAEELVQDATAIAAKMLHNVEAAGMQVMAQTDQGDICGARGPDLLQLAQGSGHMAGADLVQPEMAKCLVPAFVMGVFGHQCSRFLAGSGQQWQIRLMQIIRKSG